MIGINRQTDYAARIILHLACLEQGAQASIAEIAKQRLLPVPFVRRLVARLVKNGILKTARGAAGGIRLARPAERISLLDVVNAMEGGIVLNRCVDAVSFCPLSVRCPVQKAWTDATQLLERHLASINFSVLAHSRKRHVAAHRKIQGCPSPSRIQKKS
jgi:Rrf2 family protein